MAPARQDAGGPVGGHHGGFRSRWVWGAALFAAVLALAQSFAEITDDTGIGGFLVLFGLLWIGTGVGLVCFWLWTLVHDVLGLRWRGMVSSAAVPAVLAAVWWQIMSVGPAAQVLLTLGRPRYDAAIAALPADTGHRRLSWYWGDVGSAITGGVRYYVLVYDEAGTMDEDYRDSRYCVDGGPCTLRHIRGNCYLVMSHP